MLSVWSGCWIGDSDPSSDGETTVQGRIDVVIIEGTGEPRGEPTEEGEDDTEHAERTVVYLDTDEGDVLELELPDGSDPSSFSTGDRVTVTGTRAGRTLRCGTRDDIDVIAQPPTLAAAGVNTTKKVAVILFNFQNDTSQPITAAYAKERIFTAETSSNAFLKEASFNQLKLAGTVSASGDVLGWYTIADDNNDCDTAKWRQLAAAQATAAGNNLSAYTNHLFVFPSAAACEWAGLASVGGTWSMVKSSSIGGGRIAAHELGHNLGLSHASSYTCTSNGERVTLSSTCTTSTYGDLFDVMGSGYRHPNGYEKARLGWLAASNIKIISTTGTHIVDLAPLGATTTAAQVLRVVRPGNSNYYYVEYRQPTSVFDNFVATHAAVNGLSIRLATDPATRTTPLLLDMNPATSTFNDAPLPVGATFVDVESGVSIQLMSRTTAGARVRVVVGSVTAPAPDTSPPLVSITAPAAGATVTGTVALSATASDNRGVTRVEFTSNGAIVGTDTMSPFTWAWNSNTIAAGTRSISARAYDAAGNVTVAAPVSITIDNTVAPPELIANGGFEGGVSPWARVGNAYYSSASSNANTGPGYVYLGATQNAAGTVTQTISIPAGSAQSLTYWLNVTSQETTTLTKYDRLYVEIRSTTGTLLKTLATYSNLDSTFLRDYHKRVHSLAAFAGQTVVLQFRVTSNASNTSWFRIDDVSTL